MPRSWNRQLAQPALLAFCGIDDDSPIWPPLARGYGEKGAVSLADARQIHWSAKSGNGSAYSAVNDERRWMAGFLSDKFLSLPHQGCDNTQSSTGSRPLFTSSQDGMISLFGCTAFSPVLRKV
jgi:hypothetical protein